MLTADKNDTVEILQTCYFGYFRCACLRTPKVILSTCRKTFEFVCKQKINFIPILFWRYCKDMQTSYFAHFEHAWLGTPKTIV